MNKLIPGIYELLHTRKLHEQLVESGLLERSVWAQLDTEELVRRLSVVLARKIAVFISQECVLDYKRWKQEIDRILGSAEKLTEILESFCPLELQSLQQIKADEKFPDSLHPDTPLSASALLTGSSRTPSLRSQLIKELATCERAEWLVSFIKFSGILPLLPVLQSFTADPHPDGGPRLRLATTSYMGATDLKAVSALLKLPNTEVRISYDTKRTRLHAKSYLFHRSTGFSSAYIGSANISKAALDEGLEWTVKISQYETAHLWAHAVATFASHWEDQNEFSPCEETDLPALEKALNDERGIGVKGGFTELFFDLRPYGYQQVVLDDIAAERASGKNKHLIIAATGTGKTMIAAFDYKNFCVGQKGRPRLLFIAHRKEILEQARTAFRHDLRELLEWLLKNKTPTVLQKLPDLKVPLNLHCSYSREQILLSLGRGSFEKPYSSREGVLHVQEKKLDVFFADINKSEADFSPTTMYDDYAITEKLFHWQSQSGTGENTETGRRYIEHQRCGYKPLLFIREQKKRDGLTLPYFFAGPLKYRKHEGSKPISFIWELEYPLPAKALSWARRIS